MSEYTKLAYCGSNVVQTPLFFCLLIPISLHPSLHTPASTLSMNIDPALMLPPFTNPNPNAHSNAQLLSHSAAQTESSNTHPHHPILPPTTVQPGPTHVQPPAGEISMEEPGIAPRLIAMEAKYHQTSQELETVMCIPSVASSAHTHNYFQGRIQVVRSGNRV